MKLRKLTTLLLVLLMLLSLTACGGSSKAENSMEYYSADMAPQEAPMEEAEMGYDYSYEETVASGSLSSDSTASPAPTQRKWIVTMEISAETDDLDALMAALRDEIDALGGYVEDQNIYNGSTYASHRYRHASFTVRIPAADADKFAANMAGIANVVRSNKSLEDITLTYVSTESRVKALQTEEARLLELLAQADNMSDLLEIEARLTDVRYQLENHASRLKVYDNQVDYATIHLSVEEVQEYTPVAERTVWQRITEGFADSLEGLWEDLTDLFVWVIVSLPYLAVWAAVITAVILLVKKLRRKTPVRSAKRKTAEPPKEPQE